MARTLYIIDGFAQIFRAYYAIRNGMQSPVTGEPTHAVFGFTGMLFKLLEQYDPDFIAVALDAPGKTFRDELYPQYKANRDETPDDLKAQIPRVIELIEGFGIPTVSLEGVEADDVIATLVDQVTNEDDYDDVHVRIISRDKDLEQLLSDRVTMFDIHREEEVDVDTLKETKGITPDQVVDMLALVGDTADNVPGVPGIGPKTASTLLQKYGTIDNVYENIDDIRGKRKENLQAHRDDVALARELVTLKRDSDIQFSLDDARVRPVDITRLLHLFQQLGFRRYQDQVKQLAESQGIDIASVDIPEEPIASAETEEGERAYDGPKVEAGTYETITSASQLDDLVATLNDQPLLSVDIETTSLGDDARVCGIAFAWKEGHGVYVPTLSPTPDVHLNTDDVLAKLRPLLENPAVKKCGHNLKFDARVLGWEGVTMRGVAFDTMLASMMINPARPGHRLEQLVRDMLGYDMKPITDFIGSDENGSMADVALEHIARYAAEDADMTLRLVDVLKPQLKELNLLELLTDVEAPLAEVLAGMEVSGILCNPDELKRQGEELSERVEQLKERIYEASGCTFNIDSPRQLADVLFSQLGLPPGKKTKTGYSTDIEVLTNLAANEDQNDPHTLVPGLVIEYRQLAKLMNTYLTNLREAINPETKRIHTTFHQLVTATGRLASQNPNLQNIPVRTDVGRQIRKAFEAPVGHRLITADYSQIELRVLAHLSEDPGLLDAFQKGEDIHNRVASEVYGVPIDDVDRQLRDHAKVINFGIIYGITAFGLSRRIEGMTVGRAQTLINDYKERFPGIDTFLQQCVEQAKEHGYVQTILGRRRAIPEIQASHRGRRAHGERLAINTVVQGSAADLIKLAMVRLGRRIAEEDLPMKLLLQIHDELVLEAPENDGEAMARIVQEEMEGALSLKVPLVVETGIGPDWMSTE